MGALGKEMYLIEPADYSIVAHKITHCGFLSFCNNIIYLLVLQPLLCLSQLFQHDTGLKKYFVTFVFSILALFYLTNVMRLCLYVGWCFKCDCRCYLIG